MGELHSFHIFFRDSCIHRYLCSYAAVTAVKHCTSFDPVREKASAEVSGDTDHNDGTKSIVTAELSQYNAQYEKLLIGFISGLTSFCKTIHVTNSLEDTEGLSVSYFNVCATSTFKIHYFETVTGYKLVCITSPDVASLELTLSAIYTDLIVKMVLYNPLYTVGGMISNPEFENIVAKTLRANL
ncbi:sybindin domain containing protein [Babesia ovis]|uniref:Trafficking protein particle complex subunit n=1 Tax=Babesia ovis TaxID=5869 RepID=A0A9W5TD35_BABOV|nr:sybindin domain containing protein [Babesia ovis]